MAINDVFREFIRREIDKEVIYSKIGIASEVDLNSYTFKFSPLDKSPDIFNVHCKTIQGAMQEAFFIVPANGSLVIVTFISKTKAFLSLAEEAQAIRVNTADWTFNEGQLGGLINIEPLLAKINNLEMAVNQLSSTLDNHVHIKQGQPGLTGMVTAPSMIEIELTDRSEIEDTYIKH